MSLLRNCIALACLATPSAAGGEPPIVTFPFNGPGVVEINASVDAYLYALVTDPNYDLTTVSAKIFDGETVYLDGPIQAGFASSYYMVLVPALTLNEDLLTLEVTASDAEGNVTVGAIGVRAYHPPVVVSVGLSPANLSASESALLTAELIEEHPSGGTAYGQLYNGQYSHQLQFEMTWDPVDERLEAEIDGFPTGGFLTGQVVANDPWSASPPFAFAATVTPAIPKVDAATPSAGGLQSMPTVTIHGDGFFYDVDGGSRTVHFGELEAVVSWVVDESLSVEVPVALAPGPVDVTVSLSKGGVPMTSTLAGGFTYLPGPTIAALDPSGAPPGLGFEMRIVGAGFDDEAGGGATTVALGDHVAQDVAVIDDGEIRAVFAPIGDAPDQAVDLIVTCGTGVAIAADVFTFDEIRLLPVDELSLPPTTPARSVAFVGWLDQSTNPGSFAVGRPDAPLGERVGIWRAGQIQLSQFVDSWFPAALGPELGDLAGFEGPYQFCTIPGSDGVPELLVGSTLEQGWSGITAGALHAIGCSAQGHHHGDSPNDELGRVLMPLRDEDRDGVAEIVLAGAPGSGHAYIIGTSYEVSTDLVFASAESGDRHGASLAAREVGPDTYCATGAPSADPNTIENAGSVYLHRLSSYGDSWFTYLGRVDGSEAHQNEGPFGDAMPIALLSPVVPGERPVLISGHPGADERRGRVVATDTETGDVRWSRAGLDPDDGFGSALVAIPDLDGDAIEELLVGAPGEDLDELDMGTVHVLSGASGAALHRRDGVAAGERFGSALFQTADVDLNLLPEILVATDSTSSPNAVRRFSPDPRIVTHDAGIGATLGGLLSNRGDVDGLSIELAAGEKLECRLYGEHEDYDPLVMALVDDAGATIVSSAQVAPYSDDGPAGVKRAKDHWRIKHLATAAETVHILVRAPRAWEARPYVLKTDRLAGGQESVTAKVKIQAGADPRATFVLPGLEGHFPTGKIVCAGAEMTEVELIDPADDSVISWAFWDLKKNGKVAILGEDCTPLLPQHETELVVHLTPSTKKVKVKLDVDLVKPLSGEVFTDPDD